MTDDPKLADLSQRLDDAFQVLKDRLQHTEVPTGASVDERATWFELVAAAHREIAAIYDEPYAYAVHSDSLTRQAVIDAKFYHEQKAQNAETFAQGIRAQDVRALASRVGGGE